MSSDGERAIIAAGIGKRYTVGGVRHDLLRDWVSHSLSPLRWQKAAGKPRADQTPRDFWALRDISFQIDRGDVVGVVGRNGAGKSTLLKIISRVTRPTTGTLSVWGRVGSLLEVGTGFHPELTGRENIFLSGAVLGMKRTEILAKFARIVEFAEIETFLDTPVKRYSSGMYIRLGFAVAAHLESEILIVDEVLAVGDTAFQRKCLELIQRLASDGRTVLIVSHNMTTLQSICRTGLWLRAGMVADAGPAAQVVQTYLRSLEHAATQRLRDRSDRGGRGHARFYEVEARGLGETGLMITGGPAEVRLYADRVADRLTCMFTIYDSQGAAVTNCDSANRSPADTQVETASTPTTTIFTCRFDQLLLVPGRYRINVALYDRGVLEDHVEAAVYFDVEPGQVSGRRTADANAVGRVPIPHVWTAESQ